MIEISNLWLVFLYGFFVPIFLGLLFARKLRNNKHKVATSITFGYIIVMSVFFLLAVPMIIMKMRFHVLVDCWKMIIWLLVILSFFLNIKDVSHNVKALKKKPYFININRTEVAIWIAALLLIVFQVYMLVGHMRTDTDDARFVAEAMEAYEMDTMLQYHPITGEYLGEPVGEMCKDVTAPFPIFMGLAGKLFDLPPAVATHVFFPLIFILLAYVVYYLIGCYLFHEQGKYVALYLFFLSLINCFAYESIYAAGYTLLSIIWQGRSVLSMIILPIIWYLLLQLMNYDADKDVYYGMLWGAVLAGCLSSAMSVLLISVLVGTYALVAGIQRRSFKIFITWSICILPCWICYYIYYMSGR